LGGGEEDPRPGAGLLAPEARPEATAEGLTPAKIAQILENKGFK
jgi:hypothetical protein